MSKPLTGEWRRTRQCNQKGNLLPHEVLTRHPFGWSMNQVSRSDDYCAGRQSVSKTEGTATLGGRFLHPPPLKHRPKRQRGGHHSPQRRLAICQYRSSITATAPTFNPSKFISPAYLASTIPLLWTWRFRRRTSSIKRSNFSPAALSTHSTPQSFTKRPNKSLIYRCLSCSLMILSRSDQIPASRFRCLLRVRSGFRRR